MSKKKKGDDAEAADLLTVNVCECKPNKMFTEEQRSWVRFLIYSRPVPCAECGKLAKSHWTMLVEFRAATFPEDSFVMPPGPTVHPPLTPVCSDHPLSLGWSDEVLAEHKEKEKA